MESTYLMPGGARKQKKYLRNIITELTVAVSLLFSN